MRYALAAAVLATLLLALVAVGQVYPVRWDDDEPANVTEAVALPGGSLSVSAGVRLTPQDVPPVVCDATTEGYLYVQKDNAGVSAAFGSVLCVCTLDDTVPAYKYYSTGNNDCSQFLSP